MNQSSGRTIKKYNGMHAITKIIRRERSDERRRLPPTRDEAHMMQHSSEEEKVSLPSSDRCPRPRRAMPASQPSSSSSAHDSQAVPALPPRMTLHCSA